MSTTDLTKGIYRRIYSGMITGRRINRVADFSERLFFRLVCAADDFGNFHADPLVVKQLTFPMRRQVTAASVKRAIRDLNEHGLISLYEAEDDVWLHIEGHEELQPGGKNGRRVQKFPRCGGILVNPGESKAIQGNPGESGGIQETTRSSILAQKRGLVNPGESRGIREIQNQRVQSGPAHHNDNDNDNHNHKNETEEQRECQTSSDSEARADVSDSDSLRHRAVGQIRFTTAVAPLIARDGKARHPEGSKQWRADETCIRDWWARVWPEGMPTSEGSAALARFTKLCEKAAHADKPMAWLNEMLKREFTR